MTFPRPVLTPNKSGIRKGEGMQIIRLVQEWSSALYSGSLIDISKTLDCVWLPGLMRKLESVGALGNALASGFRNFLFDQQQSTCVGRFSYSLQKRHACAPQGVILSPLLFSLYMNDLVKSTSGFGMAIAAFLRAHQRPLCKLLTTKLRQL